VVAAEFRKMGFLRIRDLRRLTWNNSDGNISLHASELPVLFFDLPALSLDISCFHSPYLSAVVTFAIFGTQNSFRRP
jgi:hypothetical protein